MTNPDASRPDTAMAVYLLVEATVSGRVVLDVGPRPAGGPDRLRAAGAAEVIEADPATLPLAAADGSVDVALSVARLGSLAGDVERHRWLAEMQRVLTPDGFCAVRLPGIGGREPIEELLRPHWATIELVAESRIGAIAFAVAGVEDMAVNEALVIAGQPTHFVAFAARGPRRTWSLSESLLVPLDVAVAPAVDQDVSALRAELASMAERHGAACREGDELRERVLALENASDGRADALSALRRASGRHLRQLTDQAHALELARLAQASAERRAASAERALAGLAAEVERLRGHGSEGAR